MKKFILYPMIIYVLIVLLIPREKIYYLFEEQIAKKDLIIVESDISDFVNLNIKDSILYYEKDIKLATIGNITFNTFLFYDGIHMSGIETLDIFRDLYGFDIQDINIKYMSFSPFKVSINIQTNIGNIKGFFNIKSKYLYLKLNPKDGYTVNNNTLKIFRSTEKGYIYEMDI